MNHVMVDLETLSLRPNAAIIAIGAVEFDPNSDDLGEKFEVIIEGDSMLGYSFHFCPKTKAWWDKQSPEARDRVFGPNTPKVGIINALQAFSAWFPKQAMIWGNGADFDLAILGYAFDSMNLVRPWKPFNGRCYRTLKGLAPSIQLVRQGTYHSAVDDALSQAVHMQAVVKALGIRV